MQASRTARYVALYRALEACEERPLFRDPYAKRFLPTSLRLAVVLARFRRLRRLFDRYAERRAPGARTSAVGRTCFIDDAVRRAKASQLVILGAGYDCRAHRLPELAGTRVFEVDRPEIQALKRARVPERANVRYVPIDFLKDDLGERLRRAGWSTEKPTMFIWEGVSNYLTREAVADVLAFAGRAGEGSRIVFTYIHRGVLDGSQHFEGAAQLVRQVAALGEPWRFGMVPNELESFLSGFDLVLEEDLGADEYRKRYSDRPLAGYAFYRIAVARKAAGKGAAS